MTVEYRIYDMLRLKDSDFYYDYVEFEIINHKRRRTLKYAMFLDELTTIAERGDACDLYCGCDECSQLRGLEKYYIESMSKDFPNWPVTLTDVVSPRIFKFTQTNQTVLAPVHRELSFKRPTGYISRDELVSIFSALVEIIGIHYNIRKSKPYLAQPANEALDSVYQKVLSNKLSINNPLNVVRLLSSMNPSSKGALYVVQ